MVVRTVLDKAQVELNESLRYRKIQFNNPNLYMWVEIDNALQIPYICLRDEFDQNVVRMTAAELIKDEAIKKQLKKIPIFVRPFIKLDKIIPEMNTFLVQKLNDNQFIKIQEGPKTAVLELWEAKQIIKKDVKLYELFA